MRPPRAGAVQAEYLAIEGVDLPKRSKLQGGPRGHRLASRVYVVRLRRARLTCASIIELCTCAACRPRTAATPLAGSPSKDDLIAGSLTVAGCMTGAGLAARRRHVGHTVGRFFGAEGRDVSRVGGGSNLGSCLAGVIAKEESSHLPSRVLRSQRIVSPVTGMSLVVCLGCGEQ